MSQVVMITLMNYLSVDNDYMNMEMQICESCDKCLHLNAEFSKSKQAYNDLLKSHSQLEKHCISPEVSNQLNQFFFQKDESCINQNALEIPEYFEMNDLKAQLQDKDTTICELKDIIKFLRKNNKENNVNHDRCELETINEELENSVAKLLSENERRCNEINHAKQVFKDQFDSIKKTRVRTKEHSDSLIDQLNLKSAENEDLKAQIQDKVFVITSLKNDLRKLKGKETVANASQIPSATTIAPGMFKLYLVSLAPRLLQNRDAHINYLITTQEHELLIYVRDTRPNAFNPSAKKVAVTPMNKVKHVTFFELVSSSSTNQETRDSNKPLLHSTGVKSSTSASGSKPFGNTKNNRISQPSSSNKINKVEDQPRSIKTRKNKKNHVNKVKCNDDVMQSTCDVNSISDSISNAFVKNSVKAAKFDCLCAICGKCMMTEIHDKCVVFVASKMNVCQKSKSAKKHKIQNVWKPTGTVFTNVGYKWKPTGRIFTIVGNSSPLTRITSTNVVPPKPTTSHSVEILKPEVKVYIRKPKNSCLSKMAKIVESKNANHLEPSHTWGSNATDIPSSSSLVMTGTVRFGNDQIARIMGYGNYQLGNVVISRVYYVEGLGYNLFSFGQFYDADIELAKDGLARGLPRLKFQKDHLCSACALGKSKKSSHKPKAEDTNQEKLFLLHMDLCGPMRVASINGKSSGSGLHSMTPVTSIQEAAAPRAEVLADSPVSIFIN
ncbi:hypothetical protein Tco_1108172 [Tanacetum coccineum]